LELQMAFELQRCGSGRDKLALRYKANSSRTDGLVPLDYSDVVDNVRLDSAGHAGGASIAAELDGVFPGSKPLNHQPIAGGLCWVHLGAYHLSTELFRCIRALLQCSRIKKARRH